jgi:hypothetical protein
MILKRKHFYNVPNDTIFRFLYKYKNGVSLFLDSFLVSITVHKRKRPSFFSCKSHLPLLRPRQKKKLRRVSAQHPAIGSCLPYAYPPIPPSLPPSPGPVTLGRRFNLIFRGPCYLPRRRRRDNDNEKHFSLLLAVLGMVIRSEPPTTIITGGKK